MVYGGETIGKILIAFIVEDQDYQIYSYRSLELERMETLFSMTEKKKKVRELKHRKQYYRNVVSKCIGMDLRRRIEEVRGEREDTRQKIALALSTLRAERKRRNPKTLEMTEELYQGILIAIDDFKKEKENFLREIQRIQKELHQAPI